jgi:NAD+ synthetase
MKIALLQTRPVLGDLAGNAQDLLHAAARAATLGADLAIAPELALTGYPPEDLLFHPDFLGDCRQAAAHLGQHAPMPLLFGLPRQSRPGEPLFNSARLAGNGPEVDCDKQYLPNEGVFDERRYFTPGAGNKPVIDVCGVKLGVLICEDAWHPEPAAQAKAAGAQLLCVLNASPWHIDKAEARLAALRARIQETGLPAIYVNLAGAQDELVFDGDSFALNKQGEIVLRLPAFAAAEAVVEFREGDLQPTGQIAPELPTEAAVWQALKTGLADYVQKSGFSGVCLGLSGGIDSALVAVLAADALGASKVHTLVMPSPYTAQMSLDDADELVARTGIGAKTIAITPAMENFGTMLAPLFAGLPEDATEENIQARIRGLLLMALSNKKGLLLLSTGNKSELATGYCTLYGDMAGGFAPLKDVYKTLVWRLARWRNAQSPENPPIPQNIIERAPSAELKPGQTDQDSLPPYEVLDAIVRGFMEERQSAKALIEAGLPPPAVRRVLKLMKGSEYKRRQAAIGTRITRRAFGRDWRMPLVNRFAHRLPNGG